MADNVATRGSWTTQPFGPLAPLPFHASFTRDEYETLRRGFIPDEMEDKWFVFWEADSLFFHRSWTGQGVFRVDFRSSAEHFEVSQAFSAVERQQDQDAADRFQAALLDFLIRGPLLKQPVQFPVPPQLSKSAPPGLYQHHVAGTGFPERTLGSSQPTLLSRLKRWFGL